MNIKAPEAKNISELKALWQEAFGDTDESIDSLFGTAFSHNRSMCVIEGDEVAAALYWFDCMHEGMPVAYIYAVATAVKYRGRGICRRLMECTHRHLAEQGYTGVVLVPANAGLFDFYKNIGYSVCSRIGELHCQSSGVSVPVRSLEGGEYAAVRRQLLPHGGVVQEGENLDYLLTYGEFYGGDGFLLAARRQGNTLIGIELLGDTAFAPDIVCTLGCTEGSFRIVGDDRDFAMYHPLSDSSAPPPEYFGLAFDI